MAETDMTLLGRYAANRDAEAFAELIRRYAGMVYGTCLRVLGSEADAEDVTQDCFLELARTAGKVRGAGDSAAGFIHALARSRAVDFLKQASRRRQRERAAGRQQCAGSEWAQIEPLVDAAMADLPEEQRELLVLHFLRGVTQADMAQAAGVDQSTISRRLTRAVELLREHLAKQGVEVSAGALGAAMADHILRDVPARVQQSLAKMALAGMGKAAGVGIGAKLAITAVVAAAVGATVAQHGSATQATPVAVSAPATTQAATTQTAGMPEAAELFRAFQGAQLWINKVRSLDVELEVVWTKPEGKEMKRQPPGRQRWAFDDHRVYCLHDGEVRPDMYDLRVWDGKRLICRSNTYADPEYCTYDTAPQKYFTYNASLLWLQYARHPFWFWPGQPESGSQLGKPDDWEVIAREPFHGVDCYVIEQIHVQQCMRLYVGVADLRQYGFSSRQAPEELKEKFIDVAQSGRRGWQSPEQPGGDPPVVPASAGHEAEGPGPRNRQTVAGGHGTPQ